MMFETTPMTQAPHNQGRNLAVVAMAVVCGLVGAASVAHFVAAPAATEMYAPVAVRPAVTSQAAVAPAASLAPLSAPIAAVAEQQQAEEGMFVGVVLCFCSGLTVLYLLSSTAAPSLCDPVLCSL